ncbi:MAG: N-acetylmuramoyl-L-alanine amidase [Desulfobacteraceae bacterium]|nr:N-acetylmuramoyl-L-alanine amidase [Desulfobacteraceae bacterium]
MKLLLACIGAALLLAWASPAQAGGKILRVAIDVGHCAETKGALSARNRPEFAFNRAMASAIGRELKRDRRLQVFVVEAAAGLPLKKRIENINGLKPDLLISVHHDSVQPGYLKEWTCRKAPAQYCDLYRGYSVFISGKNGRPEASRALAMSLGAALRKGGFLPSVHHAEMIRGEGRRPIDINLGVYLYDGLVVLKDSRSAAVLLECGIVKNRSEELILRNPAYRKKFARAVRAGVANAIRDRAL